MANTALTLALVNQQHANFVVAWYTFQGATQPDLLALVAAADVALANTQTLLGDCANHCATSDFDDLSDALAFWECGSDGMPYAQAAGNLLDNLAMVVQGPWAE